jgi:uncharacterized protein
MLDALPRLRECVVASAEELPQSGYDWTAVGSVREPAGRDVELRLHLRAHGTALVACQRCLEPMRVTLDVDAHLRFVGSEAQAERLDEFSDEEDVLALSARLDLVELLEDELILALPLVPRHEGCPTSVEFAAQPGPADASSASEGESPFAALARLRDKPAG